MSDLNTNSTPPAPRQSPSEILWKLSWPYFGFSVIFSLLLILSWTYLLPRYTKVEVNGLLLDPVAMEKREDELTAEITKHESERKHLVSAVDDPAYRALTQIRATRVPLLELQKEFFAHAAKATGSGDIVHVSRWEYDTDDMTLTVTGDVRNVSTSSMTVLAEFITTLPRLSFAKSFTTPSFARLEDKAIGLYSPFTITFSLR